MQGFKPGNVKPGGAAGLKKGPGGGTSQYKRSGNVRPPVRSQQIRPGGGAKVYGGAKSYGAKSYGAKSFGAKSYGARSYGGAKFHGGAQMRSAPRFQGGGGGAKFRGRR